MTEDPAPSKPTYDRKAQENGDWIRVSLPPEVVRFLEFEVGDTIRFQKEDGDHGKYVSLWNPKQQGGEVE